MPKRNPLKHETPHWVCDERETFFVTVCCKARGANVLATSESEIASSLVDSVKFRNEQAIWWCSSFIVMPDHVHGLIQFPDDPGMIELMKRWKAWTAKTLGIEWQRNWFDHRLRREESWREKSDYIFNNPVRAGLVERPEDWPWFFSAQR